MVIKSNNWKNRENYSSIMFRIPKYFPSIVFSVVFLLLSLPHQARSQGLLSPEAFYNGVQDNQFDAVLDVRTQAEWDEGHIVNATLIESLASLSYIPDEIIGCKCGNESKVIVVYCRTGGRATTAINLLLENGFNDSSITLYNGQGVSQWLSAGYGLEIGDSLDASCAINEDLTVDNDGNCVDSRGTSPGMQPTNVPNKASSSAPTSSPVSDAPLLVTSSLLLGTLLMSFSLFLSRK